MHADEIVGPRAVGGQAGDRQSRGIGADDRIRRQHRFQLPGHIGLDAAILENSLDHQFDAGQRRVVRAGVDARQDGVGLLARHALLLDVAFEPLDAVGFALVSRLLVAVEQDHLDTQLRAAVGDACPIRPAPSTPIFWYVVRG